MISSIPHRSCMFWQLLFPGYQLRNHSGNRKRVRNQWVPVLNDLQKCLLICECILASLRRYASRQIRPKTRIRNQCLPSRPGAGLHLLRLGSHQLKSHHVWANNSRNRQRDPNPFLGHNVLQMVWAQEFQPLTECDNESEHASRCIWLDNNSKGLCEDWEYKFMFLIGFGFCLGSILCSVFVILFESKA